MPLIPSEAKLLEIDAWGLGGLNTFADPENIDNSELTGIRNMIFQDGILQNRQGSLLYLAKPSYHTTDTSLSSNLISYYKLDSNSNDYVGSNNLSDTNVSYSNTGIINNSATYNGTSSKSISSSSAFFLNASGFSISFWYKTTQNVSGSLYPGLVNFSASGTFTIFIYAGILATNIADSNGVQIAGQGDYIVTSDGNWHHCVFVNNGSGVASKLYRDGILVSTGTANTFTGNFNNMQLSLGDFVSSFFQGSLDEVGIWNRALSSAEVSKLYNSGSADIYPFMVLITESQSPSQLLVATNSNGNDFLISNYGTSFYLADTTNTQWIKLNTTYSPVSTGIFYGSVNWNNGMNDDRFYFGNGVDDTMKWTMSFSTLKNATAVSDTILTLNSAISFPPSGNVIVMNAGTAVILPYTSIGKVYTASTISFSGSNSISDSANGFVTAGIAIGDVLIVSGTQQNNTTYTVTNVTSGTITTKENTINESAGASVTLKANNANQINLSSSVNYVIPAGSSVTVPLVDATSVPIGCVFAKSMGRLFIANAKGAENTLHYSVAGNPENYTYTSATNGSGINSGGFYTLYKGKGDILGMSDFGQYLLIEKVDVLSQFIFNYASDNSGFTVQVLPVISGDGIGPTNDAEILNYMNTLYYPTTSQGIVSFSPEQTGSNTTSNLNLLSAKINNLITEQLNFSLCRTCGYAQKLYWLCALPQVGTPVNTNNLVLVYDLVQAQQNQTGSAWTVYDNWNAVDLKNVNNNLYYLSNSDGGVYLTNQGYQDAVLGNPIAYNSVGISKKFNINAAATLVRPIYVYLEGIVAQGTKFYVQIFANENGALGTQSFTINGNNPNITYYSFNSGMGVSSLGTSMLGGTDLSTVQNLASPLFFRAYLEIEQGWRAHNLSAQFYSNSLGAQWGISQITFIYIDDPSIDTNLILSPSAVPIMQL